MPWASRNQSPNLVKISFSYQIFSSSPPYIFFILFRNVFVISNGDNNTSAFLALPTSNPQ